MLNYLLEKAGINKEQISIADKSVRTGMNVRLTISNGKIDVGIAVASFVGNCILILFHQRERDSIWKCVDMIILNRRFKSF